MQSVATSFLVVFIHKVKIISTQALQQPKTTVFTETHARFSQSLIDQKITTKEQLQIAKRESNAKRTFLGETLIRLGFVEANHIREFLSASLDYTSIDLSSLVVENKLPDFFTKEYCIENLVLPFKQEGRSLHLATYDPENILLKDKIREQLPKDVDITYYHSFSFEVLGAIEKHLSKDNSKPPSKDESAVKLINDLLLQAVREGASDIHFFPQEHSLAIQFRLDGVLQERLTIPKPISPSIAVRLKVMSSLDIAESRRPQSGRFSLTMFGREIDFRTSTHPTAFGESIVVRILDKGKTLRNLTDLGVSKDDISLLKSLVQQPNGMILISGPTGAGKTTTLYAMLSYMDFKSRNIMTLEDPIEYRLPGIRQTEIRDARVMTYGEGVKSILRQDPDVIFISEIRDEETAQMALRASMTGHLVLATIHANDAMSIPSRLLDLGVSQKLLANNLLCCLSQRLLRKSCTTCQAKGCKSCHKSGYAGRQAILEALLITPGVKEEIAQGSPLTKNTLKGFSPLKEKALRLQRAGITTVGEVGRVIGGI